VAASIIGSEVVIVHFSTGMYFSLQGVAVAIWPFLGTSHTIGEIIDAVANGYHISYEQARKDLLSLIYRLLEEDVVSVTRSVPEINTGEPYRPHELLSHDDVERGYRYVSPQVEAFEDMQDIIALDGPMPPVSGDGH
jgi:hypothetical protein